MNEIVITSLNVYPNPTDGTFTLELKLGDDLVSNETEADVQIMNVFGQSIYLDHAVIVNGELIQEIKLDQNVPSGNYFVRVILDDQVFTGQVVFQK